MRHYQSAMFFMPSHDRSYSEDLETPHVGAGGEKRVRRRSARWGNARSGAHAASLAHELQQPLTALTTYTGTAMLLLRDESSPEAERVRELLQRAQDEALRAGAIVRRLRDHVTNGRLTRTSCSMSEILLRSVERSSAYLEDRGVQVRTVLGDPCVRVAVDRVLMEQVVCNLLRNAADAFRPDAATARCVRVSLSTVGETVEVAVADNGAGIRTENLDRAFEPYFSTKAAGTGVGLAFCRWIVGEHGGKIALDRNPTGGVTARLSLPFFPSSVTG